VSGVRRSIDEGLADDGAGDEVARCSWAVSVSDDYDDVVPRIVVTVEELGHRGEGLAAHLRPAEARRLRAALRVALGELGEPPGT
jgi:hypothetical protein